MRMILSSEKPVSFFQMRIGFLVVVIDGDGEPLLVEAEVLRQQLPGERDRPLLEVVAEREVAEHLEERVVARGVADIVEVVVLAAGAHALLRDCRAHVGARLLAGEHVLELHHAGVGEHQRRVVARHERGRRHHLVAVLLEEVEKRAADVVDGGHRSAFGLGAWRRPALRSGAASLGLSVGDCGPRCQAPAALSTVGGALGCHPGTRPRIARYMQAAPNQARRRCQILARNTGRLPSAWRGRASCRRRPRRAARRPRPAPRPTAPRSTSCRR